MARFVKGDVVVVPFPFSDLTQTKRRPALVLAELQGDDLILRQITSRLITDQYAILIDNRDFSSGSLRQSSNARPNRLFTADQQIILYRVGNLKSEKVNEIILTYSPPLRAEILPESPPRITGSSSSLTTI